MAPSQFAGANAFDTTHAAWTGLLHRPVRLLRGEQASQVAYAGLAVAEPTT